MRPPTEPLLPKPGAIAPATIFPFSAPFAVSGSVAAGPDELSSHRRSLATAGAIGVGVLGVPLWIAHAMNAADIFRLPSEHLVTGWSSSLLFIGLAVGLWLLVRSRLTGRSTAAVAVWAILGAAAVWQLAAAWAGFSLGIPGWDSARDRMSWVTALGALVTAGVIVACLLRPGFRPLLSWLALLLFVGAVMIVLGYGYSLPFFYAGDVRPVGFLSSVAVAGVALSLAAIEGVDHSPLQGLFGTTMEARLLRVFVPLVVALMLTHGVLLHLLNPFVVAHPAVRDLSGLLLAVLVTGLVVGKVARHLGAELDQARELKEKAELDLRTLNGQLEDRVTDRTRALEETNARLVQAVTHLHKLEEELVEVTAREHERIGRDLHDSIGQLITSIGFLSKAMEEEMRAAGAPGAANAGQIRQLAVQALQEARDLARGFFPVEIENHGLGYALHELAQLTSRTYGVDCSVRPGEDVREIPKDVAVHLYRITQEAITNAIRHGQAQEIAISIENRPPWGQLAIWNNGLQFDPDLSGTGVGLTSMQHRAKTIGGSLTIQRPGEGMRVVCRFPARSKGDE